MWTTLAITWWDKKLRLRTDNHSLVWLMSFKEPQGQVARWLGRLQYDSEIRRHPGRLHNNADALSKGPRRQHGNCPSCTPTGLSQVTVVARYCWYPLCTCYVLCRLLKEWRKPAVEELHVDALCCSCCLGPV